MSEPNTCTRAPAVGEYALRGMTMGIPLLDPWANRLGGFRYRVDGKDVVLPRGENVIPGRCRPPDRRPVRRTDGWLDVTYGGHPLYYYVGDRRLAQVVCPGVTEFGGVWYVVAPSGHPIR